MKNLFIITPKSFIIKTREITLFWTLFILNIHQVNAQVRPLMICPAQTVSNQDVYAGASGGIEYIYVTTLNNCTNYTVVENLDWVSFTKSGLTVTLNISPNTGEARGGLMTIGSIFVAISQGCGNFPAAAGSISGTNVVCAGQSSVNYYVAPISGATGYSWTLPNGASIISGNNTNSIYVNYSSSASSGNISVAGTGCGGGNSSPNFYVTVSSVGQPGNISGTTTVCSGGTYNYSVTPVTGATNYSWTIPSGASGSSSSNSLDVTFGSSGGNISVTAINAYGCVSAPRSTTVSMSSTTIFSMYGGGITCPGLDIPVGLSNSLYGVQYKLYLNGQWVQGAAINSPGGAISWNKNAPGSYTIKAVVGCELPMQGVATITNRTFSTNPTGIAASPNSPICRNTSTTLSVQGGSLGDGASWKWYINDCTGNPVFTGPSYTVTPQYTTTYCVRAEGTCNFSQSASITITVINSPVITQQPTSVIVCNGAATSFSISAAGNNSYQWQFLGGGQWTNISGATLPTYNINSTTGINGFNFRCVVTGSCGYSTNSDIVSVTFRTLELFSVTGGGIICPNSSAPIGLSNSTLATVYNCYLNGTFKNSITGTGSPISFGNKDTEGTYTVKGISPGDCEIDMNGSVHIIFSDPTTSITSQPVNSNVMLNSDATFSVIATGPNLQYQWQSSPSGNGPWTSLSGSQFSGYLTTTLTVPVLSEFENVYFRCMIISDCNTIYSDIVNLVINYPEIQYLEGSGVPDPENRQLNLLLPVGSSGGSYNINSMGSSTYNIPIFSPPGTNAMQPDISVSYNSQGGSGLLGYGWSLAGLSSITRINKPYYVDNDITGVNLDANDSYAIDGNRMVITHDQAGGFDGDIYKTEVETFKEITAKGISGNGPQWFSVKMKNGTIIEYGKTANSIIKSSNNTTLVWNITRIIDPSGNYCEYTYDIMNGQAYLQKILYTGNTNTDLEPYNELSFTYGRKTDINESYFPGLKVPQKLILTKIESISESEILRTYEFRYSVNLYSHLVELVETGLDNIRLNSTIFKWGDEHSPSQSISSSALNPESNILYTGDFNGDGIGDIITVPKKEPDEYSADDKWKLFIGGLSGYEYITQGDLDIHFNGFVIVDGDNDGDEDVYWKSVEHIRGSPYNNISFKFYSYNGNDLTRNQNLDLTNLSETVDANLLPSDFDGDGTADFLITDENNNSLEFLNVEVQVYPNLNMPDRVLLVDFNGDGKTDIATIKKDVINATTTLNVFGYNSVTKTFIKLLTDYTYTWNDGIYPGDFNGDGKTDFLVRKDNNNIVQTRIFFSTGTGILEKSSPITCDISTQNYPVHNEDFPYIYTSEKSLDFFINDFNRDGKADILKSVFEKTKTVSDNTQARSNSRQSINENVLTGDLTFTEADSIKENVFISNGLSFIEEPVFTGLGHHYFSQLDNNHDGSPDLLIATDSTGVNIIEFFPDDQRHLLSSVTDGKNLKVEFEYKSLTDNTVYSRVAETVTAPVYLSSYPLKVVAGVKTSNNNDNTLLQESVYKYTNLKIHSQGKGILGFAKVESQNLNTTNKNVSEFDFDTQYFSPYTHISTNSINGNPVSVTTSVQSFKSFDNGSRYLPYISSSEQSDILNNTYSQNTLSLDLSGNISQNVNEYLNGNREVISQTTQAYSNYNSFGAPQSVTTSNTRNNETITRTKTFVYNSTTGLPESETDAFGSSPSVVTTFSYNDFGNPVSVTISSGNNSRTNTNIYEPLKSRFVTGKINTLGDTISYTFNKSGNVLTVTDISGLSSSSIYDEFGNLKQTTLPDNRVVTTSLSWSLNSLGIGESYYSQTESSGKPTVVEYFDILGRKIRSKSQGFDGTYLTTDTKYDSEGRVFRSYNPYFEGSQPNQYTEYAYDDYNRITTKTVYPNNTPTTFSYDPLRVTITSAGQTKEKLIDASGLQVQSTDEGGSIQYIYNPEGKVKQINSPSGSTSIDYDDYGYQKTLEDLDAGTIEYTYNALGELQTQADAKGNQQTFTYDNAGRIESLVCIGGESITYDYFAKNRQLKSITSSNGTRQRYEYDDLNRLHTRIDSINNDNKFTAVYNYATTGEIDNVVLNNSVTLGYSYNTYGYLNQVQTNNQLVWNANSMNKYGVVDNYTLGNQANTSISYDVYGFVNGIATVKSGNYLQNWNYDFNHATGNLTSRTGLNTAGTAVQESFTYDGLNRLLTYSIGENTNTVVYDGNGVGNITGKTDVGSYDYTAGIHNVASISDPTTLMQNLPKQAIEYTKFNKVSYIRDSTSSLQARELFLTYGPDQQRVKTVYKIDNIVSKTKYFALGQYEKEIDSTGNARELYYISGSDGVVAILQKMNNQDSIFYVHKDYLGSYDVISSSDGTVKERNNFDPWGRRRNPADWSYDNVSTTHFLDRGFTGHEHLDQFGLINMNGRVYDPLLAMFLSPDNNLQAPDFTQNFNRYSYCLNNPLLYSDPTGMTYYKLNNNQWETFEFNPFQGGDADFRAASGGGIGLNNSPGFEENMLSKGYVYETNENGIGSWVSSSSNEDRDPELKKVTMYLPGTFIPITFVFYVPNGKDGYTNQYKNPAASLDEFAINYKGKTENQIVFGQASFCGYKYPNDINKRFRFVKLDNGREIDMIHFMVVGRRGDLLGTVNEIKQSLSESPSAFYPQDLYSNKLGINFFNRYESAIKENPTRIAEYIDWYLSNPENW